MTHSSVIYTLKICFKLGSITPGPTLLVYINVVWHDQILLSKLIQLDTHAIITPLPLGDISDMHIVNLTKHFVDTLATCIYSHTYVDKHRIS